MWIMHKALDWFMMGLCGGMGFWLSKAVLDIIGDLIQRAG